MKEELKKLLQPHYGHLDFLLKIKRDEISLDDMAILIDLINDKNLISNLPKELHRYNSYYTLMKDLFFVKSNITLLSNIKRNLSPGPRDIILSLLKDDSIVKKINMIFDDEKLKTNFLRWSSRIKDEKFAKFFINSVFDDSKIINIIDEKSNLIELLDYDNHSKYIPSCWCIKKKSTFYSYLQRQRIFILRHKGRVYGVNVYKYNHSIFSQIPHHSSKYSNELMCENNISIMNDTNKTVVESLNDDGVYKVAREELLKYDLYGSNEVKPSVSKQTTFKNKPKKIFSEILRIFFYPNASH
jgi:hypothetical protein